MRSDTYEIRLYAWILVNESRKDSWRKNYVTELPFSDLIFAIHGCPQSVNHFTQYKSPEVTKNHKQPEILFNITLEID